MDGLLDRILTTGADGMVGSYVNFGVRTNHRMLDVTDLEQTLDVVERNKPLVILHLAAETDVDRCERDPQYAYAVNAQGTYNIAIAAKKVGAVLVYVSTSGVFDGRKKEPYTDIDLPNPQSYYGHSKYAGELIVRGIGITYIIARICNVFGGGPKKDQKFVGKIMQQLHKPEIRAVADQYGSPTFGKDLIKGVLTLLQQKRSGIFHMSNAGACSRYELAKHIVRVLDSPAKIIPARLEDFPSHAPRGVNEAMTPSVSCMRFWQEALTEYLQEEWNGYNRS